MSEANKAMALRFVEAMGSNDPQTARDCFAPGGAAVAMGTSSFAGRRDAGMIADGIEAFKALLPDGLNFTIDSVTAEGDRVVVEADGHGTTYEGTPYRNRYCMVFTMENGKIKQANEYFCSKLAEEVLWPLAQKMGALGETGG
jgi:ketosteroid isomerase-like protein